jgi:hypothetical protein
MPCFGRCFIGQPRESEIMTRFTTLLSLALLAAAGSAPASAQPVDPVTRQQGTVLL